MLQHQTAALVLGGASAASAASAATASTPEPHKLHAVRLVRSPIGHPQKIRDTLQILQLKKVNGVVIHKNTPAINGMLNKVINLVEVKPVEFRPEAKTANGAPFVTPDGIVLGATEQDFLKAIDKQ